jgi:hypothetical protein
MNVNKARPHAGWKDMFKKVIIEETDREERRKRI